MRTLCFIGCLAALLTDFAVHAEDRKCPYEAVVDADGGENVWSGPGAKHYPTHKLNKGDRVTVRRHDPGGWCMITPPEGSFSWVRAEYVKRDGSENKGSLIANRVVVHTGSMLNAEDYTTVQGDLSKGDAVEILGEKKFMFDDGPHLMLKITPIRAEFRWIKRNSIVPLDAMRSDPIPDDGQNSRKRGGPIANDSDAFTRPVSTGPVIQDERGDLDSDVVGIRRPSQFNDQPGKQRLMAIDQQFREMIQQDPPTWNLDALAEQYKQLDMDVGTQSISTQIGLRMDAVKRYRKIHQDYVDLYRLTSERKKREIELSTQQNPVQPQPDGTAYPPTTVASLDPQPVPQPNSWQTSPVMPRASTPTFEGAGIVQKMAKTFPGGPQFVLVAPDGRMLTYLQPGPGIDLNRYVGRSMGINGRRMRRDDWNADSLTVQSLQPVQLRGMR
jgi:hypothetical protein